MQIAGKKRILITGGAGFIGTHLVEILSRGAFDLTVLDLNPPPHLFPKVIYHHGDVRDRSTLAPLISTCDAVVHLAALVSVPLCEKDPLGSFEVNTGSTRLLLELINEQNQARPTDQKIRIIFSSSSAVYGDIGGAGLKIKELSELPAPISHYGSQKLESEKSILRAATEYHLPAVVFRFFNVYGPGQKNDSSYSGVISLFVRLLKEKKPLHLNGGGKQTRDFISIRDVVTAITQAIHIRDINALNGVAINLGSGEEVLIESLAKSLLRLSGKEVELISAPSREGDILHSCADITRARQVLNWKPSVSLAEGLQELLKGV